MLDRLKESLVKTRQQGFEKHEVALSSPQSRRIAIAGDGGDRNLINMCANNYLGLANHPEIIAAAKDGLDHFGFGMASVRFICGTQTLHKDLESRLSQYLGTDDTILYSSCFDANTGLFETILDEEDVILSDELNHASIIDGIRLTKASRIRYKHDDMTELEAALKGTNQHRSRLIVTDGVFSMDGTIANLAAICGLAQQYDAMVMVDDSHAVGVIGTRGRGTPALHNVGDKVDILTGTLGKALGGASGGYVSGRCEVISWLRQASRPYLFSNSVMPAICAASIKAIDLAESGDHLRENLHARGGQLRTALRELGFFVGGKDHPIVPIIVGEADRATALAEHLLQNGVLAVAFAYPVVPKGAARVRMQVSASHSAADIESVLAVLASFRR
ncbi:glycine C-acetyltransferase [Bradyrhizobium sp. SRL28]|uniref:glycine C-acetyltransferase n=1 Tax=Bradyrhizobium sp. SRL28 TaxID=2836178 RepID=UPI001BDE4C59|nr:glycine C-acetyltransferase [Bradyrhizobium sp. SRL28]MBT1516860.1 glycine C-acetyltransferase [Bradyrhizobium sp. SRL28]